jgi:predicted HTH transcriptional regulator
MKQIIQHLNNGLTELTGLIESGESRTIEFKESFGKDAIETIVAFSNCKGGL